MAFPNIRRILRVGSVFNSYKLILAVGTSSRPRYRALFLALLRPFIRNGEISIQCRCYERHNKTFLRVSDLSSDCLSTLELCVRDIYRLDRNFWPDVVIDGGGNIGLFTLRVAASISAASHTPTRFVICEPLPRNVGQIQKHLRINGVQAEVLPVCLGGTCRSIPFYCRAAHESSFDADVPYNSVMEIPVIRLQDVIGDSPVERILIKLDIEGMEVEALQTYVPTEQRAVYIVGELHNRAQNAPLMEQLFRKCGWELEFFDVDQKACNFRACSPLAVPLLGWASSRAGAS